MATIEVLVLVEHDGAAVLEATKEALTLARRLAAADDRGQVVALLLQGPDAGLEAQLVRLADRVLIVEDERLARYEAEPWLAAAAHIVADRRPILTLLAHTTTGMDLAAPLATRVSSALVTDCLGLEFVGGCLSARRPMYGGKVEARVVLKPAGAMATLRPGSVHDDGPRPSGARAPIERLAPPDWAVLGDRRLVSTVEAALKDVDIAAADLLVAVGRGVGKADNMEAVRSFADAVGATLACSRPVADKGWLPKSRQVGTSGKTVRPRVYLALGISGAYQHVAGIRGAGTIVAVNTDPDAPIFGVAHHGIVADMFRVLPVLEEKLRAAR